ncbi:MAG: type I-U CRISPR-associated helicase/endonuclease Cas3 [Acidimicrobiaceae bacterium]|nr:type I-U CRISPR-associated helicase/endonuclease Cas3 [Acidimicrobiaceae bacterium]MYD07106.1 type I-U CRISPR-associated helicase/endonuclease Cas3 [Acidimicrobiaceae bacterium]MYI59064.1 type I-U CRISPR-associated helicase/endonuclease Cas3 [Acidimicrobiaceae bacterium]
MSVPDCPGFSDWYRSIHERDPFPWQTRLAEQVAETGEWPELIGIQTGLGKTACLDIAVWALANQADRDPRFRTVPTRIWWVVNRRILVDDTYRHALRLEALLADPETHRDVECDGTILPVGGLHGEAAATVQAVAARLRHLSGMGPPLQACRLRGGDSHNRPRHPAQPAIICSTIPMYGSRVLFRGYGSSRSMRPIDAALAGVDSLVLLDEAHLAQPLRVLLGAISGSGRLGVGIEHNTLPTQRMSPVVVALTATGETSGSRFDLDGADRDHVEIVKRLKASKPLSIADIAQGDPAKPIAAATKELLDTLDPGSSFGILVFVNTPKTAISVARALRSRCDCEVVIATGRTRGVEAKKAVEAIAARMSAGQTTEPLDGSIGGHLVVVATQTLEVGADLDADYMITEACGVRALTQRLGRLNRLGRRAHARGVYVHVEPKDRQWPVYGDEPVRVLELLDASRGFGEKVDMSPGNVGAVLGNLLPEALDAPVLAEALLWEWVKTSTPPPGEAPVEPYFSGLLDSDRDVDLVWRAHVPESGYKIWPRVSSDEIVSVPVGEARKELEGANCIRVGSDQATAERIAVGDNGSLVLRPGDTIVVACETGKLDESGHWDTGGSEPVLDASILENGLVVSDATLSGMYGNVPQGPKAAMADLVRHLDPKTEAELADVFDGAIRLCDELEECGAPPLLSDEEWAKFLQGLRNGIANRGIRYAVVEPAGEAQRLPVCSVDSQHDGSQRVSFDEIDELSIGDPVSLEAHGGDVARAARRIADAVGVTPSTANLIETAAGIHDIGKADKRFQSWLDPDRGHSSVLAKSETPRSRWEHSRAASGWPSGGRHEELSRRLASAWLAQGSHNFHEDEQNLLLHLVVAHHGHGRPLVAPVEDPTGAKVTYQIDGHEVIADADLSTVDWGQPTRFASLNKLYGCWGLALLETIVRQADHLVSAAAETALEIR